MADKYEKIAWWAIGILLALIGAGIGFIVWIIYTLVVWITSK